MLNHPAPLFEALSDVAGGSVNFYESFLVLVLLCRQIEYEQRLDLIYQVFNLEGIIMERRVLSFCVTAAMQGLCKIVGIPKPSKTVIADFIAD